MKNSNMALLGAAMGLFVAVGHAAPLNGNAVARPAASSQYAAREGGADRISDAGHRSTRFASVGNRSVQMAAGEGGAERLGQNGSNA